MGTRKLYLQGKISTQSSWLGCQVIKMISKVVTKSKSQEGAHDGTATLLIDIPCLWKNRLMWLRLGTKLRGMSGSSSENIKRQRQEKWGRGWYFEIAIHFLERKGGKSCYDSEKIDSPVLFFLNHSYSSFAIVPILLSKDNENENKNITFSQIIHITEQNISKALWHVLF